MKNSADQGEEVVIGRCRYAEFVISCESRILFIQNNCKFKDKLKHAYLGRY